VDEHRRPISLGQCGGARVLRELHPAPGADVHGNDRAGQAEAGLVCDRLVADDADEHAQPLRRRRLTRSTGIEDPETAFEDTTCLDGEPIVGAPGEERCERGSRPLVDRKRRQHANRRARGYRSTEHAQVRPCRSVDAVFEDGVARCRQRCAPDDIRSVAQRVRALTAHVERPQLRATPIVGSVEDDTAVGPGRERLRCEIERHVCQLVGAPGREPLADQDPAFVEDRIEPVPRLARKRPGRRYVGLARGSNRRSRPG
jgi:hypothetical protein